MITELVLVDDDKVLLVILEKMIRIVNPSPRLSLFSSGKEALDYLSENPDSEKSKCLLLDINLRDMSAWEFIDELEKNAGPCPGIILITSSVSSSNSEKAKKYAPVIGFFEKPITFENIRQIFELAGKL